MRNQDVGFPSTPNRVPIYYVISNANRFRATFGNLRLVRHFHCHGLYVLVMDDRSFNLVQYAKQSNIVWYRCYQAPEGRESPDFVLVPIWPQDLELR